MSTRSAVHSTFRLEQFYAASPARVFTAFSDPKIRRRWFPSPNQAGVANLEMDFHAGGREVSQWQARDGSLQRYIARYQDIIPMERIIYSYDLYLDQMHISASLVTVELHIKAHGTLLVLTEQGCFLDGRTYLSLREQEIQEQLLALADVLDSPPSSAMLQISNTTALWG